MTDLTRETVESWKKANYIGGADIHRVLDSWLEKDAELTNLRRDVEGVKDELSHSEKYRGQYRLRAERAEAALAEARREINEVARVCGEALGTDPELRTADGCARALVVYHSQLKKDLAGRTREMEERTLERNEAVTRTAAAKQVCDSAQSRISSLSADARTCARIRETCSQCGKLFVTSPCGLSHTTILGECLDAARRVLEATKESTCP